MKIDGKAIANDILNHLISDLKNKQVVPTMAVILISDNPASLSYIKQKQKAAESIGAKVILDQLSDDINVETLKQVIEKYNTNPHVHGLILQRPVPAHIESAQMYRYISANKDVDGFVPGSPFKVPVAAAVTATLKKVLHTVKGVNFYDWLRSKKIAVIGRGESAGKPIADMFLKDGCKVEIVHSKTNNPDEIIKSADIVVSCVGKANIVRHDNIKKDSILISVGLWRDQVGKLHGDYEEDDIKDTAGFYTPTPGGMGPVNVACLMENLVKASIEAAKIRSSKI